MLVLQVLHAERAEPSGNAAQYLRLGPLMLTYSGLEVAVHRAATAAGERSRPGEVALGTGVVQGRMPAAGADSPTCWRCPDGRREVGSAVGAKSKDITLVQVLTIWVPISETIK